MECYNKHIFSIFIYNNIQTSLFFCTILVWLPNTNLPFISFHGNSQVATSFSMQGVWLLPNHDSSQFLTMKSILLAFLPLLF